MATDTSPASSSCRSVRETAAAELSAARKHRGHEAPRADFLHHPPLLDRDAGLCREGIAPALEDIYQYRQLLDRLMDVARLGSRDARAFRSYFHEGDY